MTDYASIYQKARKWTLEAGQRLVTSLQDSLTVEHKTSAADIVTEKDREIEEFFVEKIRSAFPEHKILGEEGMAAQEEFDPLEHIVWIIDPIDGTTNFVHQQQNFSISVAVFEFGQPKLGIIYDPIRKECFHALRGQGAYLNDLQLKEPRERNIEEAVMAINSLWLTPNQLYEHRRFIPLVQSLRGTRSIGSAALEMAYVACGRLDGYISLRLSPWDFAGGIVILDEVGIRQTTLENKPIPIFEKSTLFVAPGKLHREVFSILYKSEEEK